jgi:hypothetical protein
MERSTARPGTRTLITYIFMGSDFSENLFKEKLQKPIINLFF